jgi:serine protease AprX
MVPTAVVLAVLAGCLAGSSAAAGTAARQLPSAANTAPITAVVTRAGGAEVGGPGVQLLADLRGVGSEVVRGTPAALAQLRRNPLVTGFQPDRPVHPTGASIEEINDNGSGVFAWQGLGGRAGRAGAGSGITVAVVDTGISDTPALNRASGRLVDGVDTSGLVAEDPAGDGTGGEVRTEGAFTDGYGHGTFLANLLAGGPIVNVDSAPGHGLGIAPGARVVSVKVADDNGVTSLAAVLAGLDWVATHRPMDVVSLALAADRPGDGYGPDPLTVAVRHLRSAGLTVVVAAGNTAGALADPGLEPQALTVGAADTTGGQPDLAPFSGYGMVHGVRKPDLVAPGVRVLSLLPAGSLIAQNNPQARLSDGLWRGSGTSQATAAAAGVAALYLSDHPNTGPWTVKSMLRGATVPMGTWRAGAGLLSVPGGDDQPNVRRGTLDEQAWAADQWDTPGWVEALDASWTTGFWTATSWSGNPWGGDAWSAKSWSAKSWSAKSWSAKSWSAKSWSAESWSAYGWGPGPATK